MRFGIITSASLTALSLFTTAASAEDWSGFYAGVTASYNSVDTSGSPSFTYAFDVDGAASSLLLGYNIQNEQFVLGVEGELGLAGVSGDATDGTPMTVDMKGLTFGARARAGAAFDRALVYAALGFTSSDMDMDLGSYAVLRDRIYGLQLGGGLEYAMTEAVNLRAEYLYTNYAKSDGLIPQPETKMNTEEHSFRVGITYEFGN